MYFSHPPASLLFVHIPRTSGTSLTKALTIRYGDRNSPRDHHKHISGRTLRRTMPAEQWRLAYKFSIVRNPWDRMVSLWNFHHVPGQTFSWWLLQTFSWSGFDTGRMVSVTVPQTMWLTDDLDRIFRFESLPEMAITLNVDMMKATLRSRTDYRKRYNRETRDIVAHAFSSDIRRFGYDF